LPDCTTRETSKPISVLNVSISGKIIYHTISDSFIAAQSYSAKGRVNVLYNN
jgi:hypothetical protein